jgi:hypothetical protein
MAIPKTQQLNRPTHESQRHLGTGKLFAVVETQSGAGQSLMHMKSGQQNP